MIAMVPELLLIAYRVTELYWSVLRRRSRGQLSARKLRAAACKLIGYSVPKIEDKESLGFDS